MALDFLGRLGGSSLGYRAGGDVHGSKAGAGIAEVGMAGYAGARPAAVAPMGAASPALWVVDSRAARSRER